MFTAPVGYSYQRLESAVEQAADTRRILKLQTCPEIRIARRFLQGSSHAVGETLRQLVRLTDILEKAAKP